VARHPAAAASSPLTAAEFDRLMARLGPFEAAPGLAVAVSGGPDSLALVLLASNWAKARGGRAVGLTVDHGLRPEAGAEARQVGRWLAARGISHTVLRWRGPKPATNLQAAARAARYRLLEGWCRKQAVLHLLLAHQREDQAETFLLRLGRGSGLDGLAAMAPVVEGAAVRLVRPLLTVGRARLVATLEAAGQSWFEDPSNRDPRHARVRLRALLPDLAREGLTDERLARTAEALGRARRALDDATARLLAIAVCVDPAGYAVLERGPLMAASEEVALRALGRLLQCMGGGDYGPRLERLERLYREIVKTGLPAARTLGGCRILRLVRRSSERLLICREPGAIADERPVTPGAEVMWDRRFYVCLSKYSRNIRRSVRLGALGERGWASLVRGRAAPPVPGLPSAVRASLPALRGLEGLLAVPHLSPGRNGNETGTVYVRRLTFCPLRPLAAGPVTVA
jgi:tRNA(Ile)-lysidine synthase